jgi:septal ring factor EnvC (AmiA/AmiB activator)
MISKTIARLFMMTFAAFSLVACGISADVHDAVVAEKEAARVSVTRLEKEKETAQASISQLEKEKETAQASVSQLEKEKETAQASVTQLEQENESVKTDLTKAQETVQNLNAVHPPRRFEDRNEIEAWLRNDDMSEREDASLAEGLLSKALEQQARALENGYIVSADYWGPDEDYNFQVWLSAVTENLDYFLWDPESDEVMFATNTNFLE